MNQMSYLQFENEMRGSRETVLQRLAVHRPLTAALQATGQASSRALDIGSGRGEWLEMLQQQGWDALGVDNNAEMINACRERGLNVNQADAKVFLETVAAGSFDMISAFHVVEHIPPTDLPEFLRRCQNALKPGGVILLETPNPQNLFVGASEFYVDPTHTRPVPPKLLDFLARDAGFDATRIVFLNRREGPDPAVPLLSDALLGVGYDYALIGQKPGPSSEIRTQAITQCLDGLPPAGLEQALLHFDQCMLKVHQNALAPEMQARLAALEQQMQHILSLLPQADRWQQGNSRGVVGRLKAVLRRLLK